MPKLISEKIVVVSFEVHLSRLPEEISTAINETFDLVNDIEWMLIRVNLKTMIDEMLQNKEAVFLWIFGGNTLIRMFEEFPDEMSKFRIYYPIYKDGRLIRFDKVGGTSTEKVLFFEGKNE